MAAAQPYQAWLDKHLIPLSSLPEAPATIPVDHAPPLIQLQQAFGYTF